MSLVLRAALTHTESLPLLRKKKNHAFSIMCSPTQKQGEDDGFSLYVQEMHKSPVLMGI